MLDSFDHIDRFRVASGPMASSPADGRNGAFVLPLTGHRRQTVLVCIATDGTLMPEMPETRWEHVSAHTAYSTGKGKGDVAKRTPTWDEMCVLKDTFWGEEEAVMQLHPRASQYVNNHPHVLHLWRPLDAEIPEPPAMLVGVLDRAQGPPTGEPEPSPEPSPEPGEPTNIVQIRRVKPEPENEKNDTEPGT